MLPTLSVLVTVFLFLSQCFFALSIPIPSSGSSSHSSGSGGGRRRSRSPEVHPQPSTSLQQQQVQRVQGLATINNRRQALDRSQSVHLPSTISLGAVQGGPGRRRSFDLNLPGDEQERSRESSPSAPPCQALVTQQGREALGGPSSRPTSVRTVTFNEPHVFRVPALPHAVNAAPHDLLPRRPSTHQEIISRPVRVIVESYEIPGTGSGTQQVQHRQNQQQQEAHQHQQPAAEGRPRRRVEQFWDLVKSTAELQRQARARGMQWPPPDVLHPDYRPGGNQPRRDGSGGSSSGGAAPRFILSDFAPQDKP